MTNKIISNRTSAIMYGIASILWMICVFINARSVYLGNDDKGQFVTCSLLACICLIFMVHYIKAYVIQGRRKIGFKESFKLYFNGLRNEYSQAKLWAPIFVGLSLMVNVVMYIFNELIKHKGFDLQDIVSAVFVSAIFAVIYSFIAKYNNKKRNQDK